MSTFKVVRMAKRGDKLPAEFRQEWLERHRELKRAVSKVVAAVAHDSNKDAEYAGMSAVYYGSAAEARAALGDDPAKVEVACEEHVIAQQGDADRLIKPSGQIKLVRAYMRRKDLSLAQFRDHWLKTHANFHKRLVSETPVLRSRASIALPPPPGGTRRASTASSSSTSRAPTTCAPCSPRRPCSLRARTRRTSSSSTRRSSPSSPRSTSSSSAGQRAA